MALQRAVIAQCRAILIIVCRLSHFAFWGISGFALEQKMSRGKATYPQKGKITYSVALQYQLIKPVTILLSSLGLSYSFQDPFPKSSSVVGQPQSS